MTFYLEAAGVTALLVIIYFGFVKKSAATGVSLPGSGPANGPANTAPPKFPSEGTK